MGILTPRNIRSNRTSTSVWLASKRRNFIRDGGIDGLGPELQSNWDMSQGVAGWAVSGATIESVTESGEQAVLITSVSAPFDRGELSVSGLEIGAMYKLVVRAKKGAQGSDQEIWDGGSPTWANIPRTTIDSAGFENIVFNVEALAASGVTSIFANISAGASGDEIYVSEISIRKIL